MKKQKNILVIDDDEAVRGTICENLEASGYNVLNASDGAQGLYHIEQHGLPDIVITDIIMPRKEGLETIMEIKKRFPAAKLIAISGGGRNKSGDFLRIAQKLGSDAVLPKPVNLDELEQAIENLLAENA